MLAVFTSVGLFLSGCSNGDDEYREFNTEDEHAAEEAEHAHHDHAEHGPHDGHLIELGEHEYHAELVFDAETRISTIYLLGHELSETNAVADAEVVFDLEEDGDEIELEFTAVPQDDDPEGTASRFQLAADKLPEHIKDIEDFHGHVHITWGDKSYNADIKHDHDHDDHGHEHEKGDKDSDAEEKDAEKKGDDNKEDDAEKEKAE
jgi:hypothetical protein